jgi:hypothetical protein
MNCAELAERVARSGLSGWKCAPGETFLRLQTPFRYSDGGWIEVFVETYANDLIVTDFGEAARFLEGHGIDPSRGATRRRLIELAIELGGATSTDGAIEIHVGNPDKLFEAALRLAQIMTRVGDLSLGARGALGATFPEELEEFLREKIPASHVERNAPVQGKITQHRVDLLVSVSDTHPAAIEALAATSANSARSQLAFTIQKFVDIRRRGLEAPTLVAVVDDSAEVWTRELRGQLENVSRVLDWEEREDLVQLIVEPERATPEPERAQQ